MFTPPGGGCAVYVYHASGIGATIARALLLDELKQIRIDDSAPFWLNKDTYLRFEVAPGTVDIYSWRATEQWHCEANEVGYFSSVAMRLRSHL